jgi:glycosyltransferase involved in cell wall biosynthesis
MRVLLVNDRLYPDFIGGVEKRNYDLAMALAARGHEVTLAGFGRGPSALPGGVRVHSFGPLGRLYSHEGKRSRLQAFRYARRAFGLDVESFDVVETSNIPYIHVPALSLRCAIARRPLLVTWYEFWGPYWRRYMSPWSAPLYRLGEWLTAQLGSAVDATSTLTAERLSSRRLRAGGVPVVACGIDFAAMTSVLEEPPAEGAEIVYAGRLIREKRVDLLIEAVASMPVDARARLAIYGEGPERGALEDLAARVGVADRVAFHGHVEGSLELWRRIRAARVAVQPSSREGFGIFPLEAMALGVPVVHLPSEDSAVGELVRDGVEGIACEASPQSLAAALSRLLGDGELRARMGAAGMARARAFDLSRIGEETESLLSALVNGTISTPPGREQ